MQDARWCWQAIPSRWCHSRSASQRLFTTDAYASLLRPHRTRVGESGQQCRHTLGVQILHCTLAVLCLQTRHKYVSHVMAHQFCQPVAYCWRQEESANAAAGS